MTIVEEKPDKAEEFIEFFLQKLPYRETLDLFLVILEKRPACLIMDPDEGEREKLAEFCREFDLEFREKSSKNESLLSSSGFFIAHDKSRFQKLQNSEGRFYGFSDRDVGDFLGFPEDDVEFFAEKVHEGPLEAKTREITEKMVEENLISQEDSKYVNLVTYVPKPSEENILEAVELGKRFEEKILEFDAKFDSSIGKRVLEEFYGKVLD